MHQGRVKIVREPRLMDHAPRIMGLQRQVRRLADQEAQGLIVAEMWQKCGGFYPSGTPREGVGPDPLCVGNF